MKSQRERTIFLFDFVISRVRCNAEHFIKIRGRAQAAEQFVAILLIRLLDFCLTWRWRFNRRGRCTLRSKDASKCRWPVAWLKQAGKRMSIYTAQDVVARFPLRGQCLDGDAGSGGHRGALHEWEIERRHPAKCLCA